MSYDLMVFEPEAAPRDHAAFLKWYDLAMEWEPGDGDSSLEVIPPGLRNWYADMQATFPDMNTAGPDFDSDRVAGYSIGKDHIYADFRWSETERAYETTKRLAAQHGLGFFDVSGSEEQVWLPYKGALRLAHQRSVSLVERLRTLFQAAR